MDVTEEKLLDVTALILVTFKIELNTLSVMDKGFVVEMARIIIEKGNAK